MIPKEIIDTSEGKKLVSFLNYVLHENPKTNNNEKFSKEKYLDNWPAFD